MGCTIYRDWLSVFGGGSSGTGTPPCWSVERKVVLTCKSNTRADVKSKSKVPKYKDAMMVRNAVYKMVYKGGIVHARAKKVVVM